MISYQRTLTSIIFFTLANLLTSIRAQLWAPINPFEYCPNNGTYADNSAYQVNLNTLLSALSTNIGNNGFYRSSVGQNSDRVNAYALCRGDMQLDPCRSCVLNATNELECKSNNYRQGIIWTEFCTLQYSNASITMSTSPNHYWSNTQNITNLESFVYDLVTLLQNLSSQASNGDSLQKVAASTGSTSGNVIIFGMVQCTPDLSTEECYSCLNVSINGTIQRFPNDSAPQGARFNTPSCNIRYEIYRFYNQTRLQEFEPSPPVNDDYNNSTWTAVNDDYNNSTWTIRIIVVSIVAGLIIAVLIGFLVMKKKQKPKDASQDDLSSFEMLHNNAS